MSETSWRDLFPYGRGICHEGDDPEGFAAEIRREFGFDPSADPAWNQTWLNAGHPGAGDPLPDPFGRTHWFLCPPGHLCLRFALLIPFLCPFLIIFIWAVTGKGFPSLMM